MGTHASVADEATKSISMSNAREKKSELLLFIVVFIATVSLTPLVVLGGVNIGFSLVIGVVVALGVAGVIVRWPTAGFFLVAFCALAVEQETIPSISNLGNLVTDKLYVFYWPPSLEGFIERPIGVLILFIFAAFLLHRFAQGRGGLQGGALLYPFLLYLLAVVWGIVHGITSGGNMKIIVVEMRPYWYMFISYLLAYNLVSKKEHIRTLLWLVIICAGIKGIQGTYIYFGLLHGNLTDHREIMAHEESFFFGALILLVVIYCLHYRHKAQLITALCVMPFVLLSLVANQRRADYIAFLVGISIAWLLVFIVRRDIRGRLLAVLLICGTVGTAYVLAFQHAGGSLGEPARAVVSVFHPDPKDANSNLYRQIENYDLKYTVKQNPLGMGFGKPFLQPIQLANILSLDPYYLYIPHNTIYWVWMRLGPLGYFALWFLIGSVIIRGCQIVCKLQDRYLQLMAIYIVAITFMQVIVAYADYQLFFFRNVIYFGLLMGVLMKLPVLDSKAIEETSSHEHIDGVTQSTVPHVGGEHTQLSLAQSASK